MSSFSTLKGIYNLYNLWIFIIFTIFDSHINYAILILGQNPNSKLRIITLQKKALGTVINKPSNSHSGLLFQKSNILKFGDKILNTNIIFISKWINNLLPPIFKNWFIFCSKIHNYGRVLSSTDKPSYRADSYGKNSITVGALNCWNEKPRTF